MHTLQHTRAVAAVFFITLTASCIGGVMPMVEAECKGNAMIRKGNNRGQI